MKSSGKSSAPKVSVSPSSFHTVGSKNDYIQAGYKMDPMKVSESILKQVDGKYSYKKGLAFDDFEQ